MRAIDEFMATSANVRRWDPNCSVDDDLSIDTTDISIAIGNFMQPSSCIGVREEPRG